MLLNRKKELLLTEKNLSGLKKIYRTFYQRYKNKKYYYCLVQYI